MLRLTQAPNIAIATLWADLLCEAGMAASVQRQYLGAAAGHLPPDQCLPEVWVEHDPHVPRAQQILQSNLQSGLSLVTLAKACGLSTRHFARAFQESAGVTPHQWMTTARITAAKAMMRQTALPLAQIADLCGFSDQSHLTRVFKREEGLPPASWRRDHRQTRESCRGVGGVIGAVGPN